MFLRVLSYLALAMLPAAALAAPGDTAGASEAASEQTDPGQQQGTDQPRDPAPPEGEDELRQQTERPSPVLLDEQAQQEPGDTVNLIAVDELIGREVVTQEGERLGTLQFVTVSLDQGGVSHLIVDTSGTDFAPGSPPPAPAQPGQGIQTGAGETAGSLLIVPWSVAEVKAEAQAQGVVVAATGRHIMNAPRLKREELKRLTEPALASYVIDYWAPASEIAALESERRQGPRRMPERATDEPRIEKNQQNPERVQEGQDVDGTQRQPDQAGAGGQQQTGQQTAVQQTGQQQTGQQTAEQLTAEQQTAQQQTDQQRSGAESAGNQVVLVGQEVVAAVTPPMFQLGEQLQGATVLDRSGQQIGQIRQIMIDSRTGDAAFAIIEGTSAGRAPVPLQTLEWTAEGTTMLTADASNLQSNQALTGEPGQASRNELRQLYQRFGADPYWQPTMRSGTRSGTGDTAPERSQTPQGASGERPQ